MLLIQKYNLFRVYFGKNKTNIKFFETKMRVKKLRKSTMCYRGIENCITRFKKVFTKPIQLIKRYNSDKVDKISESKL